ncbi:MAG: TAT-variant-translocated molybdopterin oxidoreductase [Verrucomicrobiota bacterium]
MKRDWNHPEPSAADQRLMRSHGEMQDTPEFRDWLEKEFPAGAAEMRDEEDQELTRRSFMRFMGASTALAGFGVAACRRPEKHIRAYSRGVEWAIPGKPLLYATAMPRGGGAMPMIVVTHDGRPTHLEGNPHHPDRIRGIDAIGSASILELYDPDRTGDYANKGEKVSKEEFENGFAAWSEKLGAGDGLAFLVGQSTSPTRARLLKELSAKYPASKTYAYEPLSDRNLVAGTEACFGKGSRQVFNFEKADVILSIGCDFGGLDSMADNANAMFTKRRGVDPEKNPLMNRLYVVEHEFTMTGGMADHRLPLAASKQFGFAVLLAEALGADTGGASANAEELGIDLGWVKACANDLKEQAGRALVLGGTRLDPAAHIIVAAINNKLNSFGNTIGITTVEEDLAGGIAELCSAIDAGEVKSLLITTLADPVYDAPADLNFEEKLAKVETSIYASMRNKAQTASQATWYIPGTHYLESWGDVRTSEGTYSIVQPMILPLCGGVSENELFLRLLGEEAEEGETTPERVAVYKTFEKVAAEAGADDVPAAWADALRDGFLPKSEYKLSAGNYAPAKVTPPAGPDGIEVVFTPDSKVWDGRYINNSWLQEAPDPISKVVWDNAVLVSQKTLKKLGLKEKELAVHDSTRLLRVTVGAVSRVFPLLPAPGQANDSVSISVGYGQVDPGRVGSGFDGSGTGFNVNPMRQKGTEFIATGAKLELIEEPVELREGDKPVDRYPIALTQEHNSMENRALVRDGDYKEAKYETTKRKKYLAKHPGEEPPASSFDQRGMDSHIPPNIPIYRGQDFKKLHEQGHQQWGMTVDLNVCNGCNACLVACQSENNIPVVGKEQVMIGREMHWVRMDRYFAPRHEDDGHGHWKNVDKDLENPQFLPQPVSCTHCEAAPCETVCPVNATVHNEEGLNVMAYNRCIGTRYCANNCPFKARRFNFFDYNKRPLDQLYKGPLSDPSQTGMRESLQLQKNPNVTVRMRGVMEKCTYCVQRITEARIRRKQIARDSSEGLKIPDGGLRVACQSACAADAIQFGDIYDPKSRVSKMKADVRHYELLKYIGTRSRTTYLARIKNPNPKMPSYEAYIGKVSSGIH